MSSTAGMSSSVMARSAKADASANSAILANGLKGDDDREGADMGWIVALTRAWPPGARRWFAPLCRARTKAGPGRRPANHRAPRLGEPGPPEPHHGGRRSEEHTSELQS